MSYEIPITRLTFVFAQNKKIHFSGDELLEKVWAIVFAMSGMSETSTLFTFKCHVRITELVNEVLAGDLPYNVFRIVKSHCSTQFLVIHCGVLLDYTPLSRHLVASDL